MKINYNELMIKEIKSLQNKPKLLLHSCCAPCSSHVIDLLKEYFDLKIFFFNPNIYPEEEYEKRLKEQIKLLKDMGLTYKVVDIGYKSELFYEQIKGYEDLGESSERCSRCFTLRLEETAKYAVDNNFDYFTTTLTISPIKDSQLLNNLGIKIGDKYNIKYLCSDFKKKNGYKKSIEFSKKYNLYRQDYCGCVFSKKERDLLGKNI